MGLFSKIKEGLKKTRDSVVGQIDSMLKSFTKIDDDLFEELEELLVMGDVGINTAQRICEELKARVKRDGVKDPNQIMGMLRNVVREMLEGDTSLHLATKPSIILVIGVNGVGKTTTIGKISARLTREGKKVVIAAADTFRAAAIDQLAVWADRSRRPGKQASSTRRGGVRRVLRQAEIRNADVIICDTAGRLHNKKNLMDELSKIGRIIDRELPEAEKEILLVLDAATGQNAVNQAREFKNSCGITGIVLTKLDGTARGGVVIAIKEDLNVPVKFIGVGEQIDDLQPFDPEDFANALFEPEQV